MSQTEDIDYSRIDDFATPDKQIEDDIDQPNKSVLLGVQKYLEEAIAESNSIDAIDLSESYHMTPTQQIAVYKLVITHLRNIKQEIDNKVKELK